MTLTLSLITNWFIMTNKLIKKEDYRIITPYWCNRFVLVNGEARSKIWWQDKFNCSGGTIRWIIDNISIGNFSFKKFDFNTMTLGYPSKNDESRILRFEHAGIEIRTGNPEWGAEPNKLYFVIKHGARI